MNTSRWLGLLLFGLIPLLPGCATIVSSGPDRIELISKPEGVTVKLDGVEIGKTPCVAMVPRSSDCVFTFELEGYRTVTIDRDKDLNPWFLGNLFMPLVAFPVALTVDLFAHNQGKYSEDPIRVELEQVVARPADPGPDRPDRETTFTSLLPLAVVTGLTSIGGKYPDDSIDVELEPVPVPAAAANADLSGRARATGVR